MIKRRTRRKIAKRQIKVGLQRRVTKSADARVRKERERWFRKHVEVI
jgi:hypothetical protein